MFTKYNTYKEEDFLTDEYFIRSMLEPTSESDAFWKQLINEGKINENEFISAFITSKYLKDSRPEVPTDRLDVIWSRLMSDNHRRVIKARRTRLLRYIVAACCIVTISLSVLFFLKYSENGQSHTIDDFTSKNKINMTQAANQIQLVSGQKTVVLNGEDATVEYDKDGQLLVNQQTVDIDNEQEKAQIETQYSQLCVPYGKRAFLKLSDGTSLWVNSGTTIVYPSVFAKKQRHIYIEGEIFADVYHDEDRPFIVSTNKINIQVLGTTFNVSAYQDDKQTNVTLIKGSVNIITKNGKATKIKPNQLFSCTGETSIIKDVDVENYISWRNGIYIFHNEPIENILLRLSRYYNAKMILPSSTSGITCSGKLELKEDLNKLLNGLAEITSMSYAIKDDEYRIRFE